MSNGNLKNDYLLRGLPLSEIQNLSLDPVGEDLSKALSILSRLSQLFVKDYGEGLLSKKHLIPFMHLEKLARNNKYMFFDFLIKEESK